MQSDSGNLDPIRKAEQLIVPEEEVGERIDRFVVRHFPDLSRSYVQQLVLKGCVKIGGKELKSNRKLKQGEKVTITFPEIREIELKGADIPLHIVYEDKDFLVLDKPAGMVVHPGTHGSHSEDSLVNALIHHCGSELSGINGVMRPGIIHRLDKDTSGLLVVAKNDIAHKSLSDQFKDREVTKIYWALLVGKIQPLRGTIDAPIGRDPRDRKKMAISTDRTGRSAVTKYEVDQYYGDFTLVKVHLLTGRTHQIRVHFASIGFPLVGDNLYGTYSVNKKFAQDFGLSRQFLHAGQLGLVKPQGKKKVEFESPLPFDLQNVLDQLSQSLSQ